MGFRSPTAGIGGQANLRLVASNPEAQSADGRRAHYAMLLQRVRSGDRIAESELVLALSEPLSVVLRQRAKGREGLEDLHQDALMAVLAAAREGRIEHPEALISYAIETAKLLALNAWRKQERQRTDADSEQIDRVAEPQASAWDTLSREQLRDNVRAVLSSLPNARDRAVLYSYYIEEQPSRTVQGQHALDSVQLGRVLHRARQRFLAMWKALRLDSPED
ncbi:RNA polymerase sigma factor [Pseudomarimonas arenosa]|uniref:Sigma-70 family RNA polymerase sigma factor n=1 Tax=Pseudomarimonas arenosa TaxID=2774145 RepID=A0AAW3ZK77_9GAMM|nr:sigma-70 family RNA polymerase sigma factor [Pseudomarimonas arenosa]MBD8525860.1 sigma-70 family RNA polymerase sigma factor [Pseudomarimonas arenosa]